MQGIGPLGAQVAKCAQFFCQFQGANSPDYVVEALARNGFTGNFENQGGPAVDRAQFPHSLFPLHCGLGIGIIADAVRRRP